MSEHPPETRIVEPIPPEDGADGGVEFHPVGPGRLRYAVPRGGLPRQSEMTGDRSVFTEAYTLITRRTMSDITASRLPLWTRMRMWVLARPMTGFTETFSHALVEVAPRGGSDRPESDTLAEAVLFVTSGRLSLNIRSDPDGEGEGFELRAGAYVYLPAGVPWEIYNGGTEPASFHWIRKRYEAVEGLAPPPPFVSRDEEVAPVPMPETNGAWATTRFVAEDDMAHDMHVNIVTFTPGAVIPFLETHVMEHGLYVLQGKGLYRLNRDWVEVEAGDYIAMRGFCPQGCYAAGDEPFRYLLYKDVNRQPKFL